MTEKEKSSDSTKNNENITYSSEIKTAQENWGKIFNDYDNGEDRVKELIHKAKRFLDLNLPYTEEMVEDLKVLKSAKTKEDFVDGVESAIKKVVNIDDPLEYEKLFRLLTESKQDNQIVNKVFYYNIQEDKVDIHVLASKTLGPAKIRRLFLQGLEQLAKDIRNNDSIKVICAESWILYRNPKLAKKLGFKIVTTKDTDKVSLFVISKEDFLKRYLKGEK